MSGLATQFAEAIQDRPETGPGWLQSLRENGAEQFQTHGLPTRKDEAWKYTALSVLEQDDLELALVADTDLVGTWHPIPLTEAGVEIIMLDGCLQEQGGELPSGLMVMSLADALEAEVVGVRTQLESLSDTQTGKGSANGFSALNTATLKQGVLIHVAAGSDAGRLLMSWSSQASDVPHLFNSRVCIILEKGARLELLEQFEDPHANTSNVVLQIDLGVDASMQHLRFQQESDQAILITRTEVLQQCESKYHYYGFDLGGRLVRHDLHASLKGRGAKAVFNGAYLLDGNRHVDNHVRVDHMAPGGFSDQYFRGVIGGSARAVFNTAVVVHEGADETEARQSNANILLSKRAEVDTKPELEIYADEVIASHGATVGQLDEQAIFYLRSRGLSEQQARRMLTTAFCRSVSDKLSDTALGDIIELRMMDVMPQAERT